MNGIETERLVIRRFQKEDGQDLYEYLSNEEVVKFEPYKPYTKEEAIKEAERRSIDDNFYAVTLKDGKLIGNLYLAKGEFETWELGYVFNNKYWNMGYAYESAKAIMKYTFEEQNAWRMVAYCDVLNPNSWKLLERLKFRREANFIQNVYFFKDENGNPIWKDSFEYAMLKSEWFKQNEQK